MHESIITTFNQFLFYFIFIFYSYIILFKLNVCNRWQTDVIAENTWLQLDDIEKYFFEKKTDVITIANRQVAIADLLPDQLLVNYTGPKIDFKDYQVGVCLFSHSFVCDFIYFHSFSFDFYIFMII